MNRATLVLLAMGSCACADPPPPPPMPEVSSSQIDEDAHHVAEGRIAGAPWRLSDARFDVVTRPGRQRVDLLLSNEPIERCGLPIERPGAVVWLRFDGQTALEPGERALDADGEGPFEVHYEVPSEDGYRASHRGVATVRIDAADLRSVRGRLRVCFADPERSCVGGTFDAAPCWSRIDGRTLREPPGLRDDALEPTRSAP